MHRFLLFCAHSLPRCEPISPALVSAILTGEGPVPLFCPTVSLWCSGPGSYLPFCFNLSRIRALSRYMPCSRFSAQTLGMWPSSRTLPPHFRLPSGAGGGEGSSLFTVGPGGRGLRAPSFPAPPRKPFASQKRIPFVGLSSSPLQCLGMPRHSGRSMHGPT